MECNVPKVPKSIWGLGVSTFLMNVSTVVIFSLCAVYMKFNIGISIFYIGLLEGIVEASAFIMKLFSGIISDRIRNRKKIMLIGFWCTALARPIIMFSSSFTGVFVNRFLGRIGNGLQSTPRDAFIGDVSPIEIKGRCYGIVQSFMTFGSFIGGVVAIVCMHSFESNFKAVFSVASIICFISIVPLILFVKEPKQMCDEVKVNCKKFFIKDLKELSFSYWFIIFIATIFMTARISESFIVLHASDYGISKENIPIILILYNLSGAITSHPFGYISDKLPRIFVLFIGFIILLISDLILAFSGSIWGIFLGTIFWGVQRVVTQNIFMTIISDLAPYNVRGTAFGIFYLFTAISTSIASISAGYIADNVGKSNMFVYSGFICIFSMIILAISQTKKARKVSNNLLSF